MALQDDDYARLLTFRVAVRRFLAFSKAEVERVGLTPPTHQTLVAIRGHAEPAGPRIADIADYMLLRHHSAVANVNRCEELGLVQRHGDDADRRVVRVRLTPAGLAVLEQLTQLHFAELRDLAPALERLTSHLLNRPAPDAPAS